MQITGSHVLITGATGGLGQAIARDLARRGARLTLSGRGGEILERLTVEVGASSVEADLSRADGAAKLAEAVGDVDILISNAGLPATGRLESFTVEQIDRALQVNLRSPIMLAHALLPRMLERRRGHLVFMSSLSGKATSPRTGIYNATKFGLRGFAGALRSDLHNSGVGVSAIFPGFVAQAGMFVDAGSPSLPLGIPPSPMRELTEAVAGAIEHNRGEVEVAPLLLRFSALVGQNMPELASILGRLLGAERVARKMDEDQRDKR